MSSPFTREDLTEEFRRLSEEIREFGSSVREDVQKELRSFLHECSSSLRSQELVTEKRPIFTPETTYDSLKQPAATGTSATGTSLREAGDASESGKVLEQPLFLRSAKLDLLTTEKPAPSISSFASEFDSHSKVHPAPLLGVVEGTSRPVSPNVVTLPLDLHGDDMVALDSEKHQPFAVPEQPFAVPDPIMKLQIPTTAQLRPPRRSSGLPRSSTNASAEYSDEDYGNEDDFARSLSAQAISSWLPGYRISSLEAEAKKRKSSKSSGSTTSFTRSTAMLVWMGQVSKSAALGLFFRGEYFDYVMGVFLMLNAVSIGIQVNFMAKRKDDEVPVHWRIIDGSFCLVFTIELLIRVYLWRGEFLRMKGWQWNAFDLSVVSFSIIDEISKLALEGTEIQQTIKGLFVLKMLRLARVVRLIRMVRLIPELKSMVYLISASMWSFFWTVMLLMILIYCVAVYYTELGTDLRVNQMDSLEELVVEELLTHYGSIGASMFSLFQAITGGDDWTNFVKMFKGHSYFINSFLFCVYIAFATLVMLNLVTGVFVEGAQRIIREDKEAELIKQVRKLFQVTDKDNSGEITMEEFALQLESKAMQESLAAVDMSTDQARSIFLLLDVDKSGGLSVEEFVQGCLRLRVPARSIDLTKLKYDFDEITNLWANQFAVMDANIRTIMDTQEHLAHAAVANMPLESYVV